MTPLAGAVTIPKNHFTSSVPQSKPAKPHPDFPLFPHATGRWAKKIRGKLHYFGPWVDPEGALKKYLEQRDALHSGRKPRPDPQALTVKDLANAFLNHKQAQVDSRELAPQTWTNYKAAADLLVGHLGKTRIIADLGPNDFAPLRLKMARKWGAVHIRDFVQRIRSIFKYADDSGLVDRPVRFGPAFKGPSRKTLRMFEAAEIRRLLDAAGLQLKAMILLGINGGFGNADCGKLPLAALKQDTGWVHFPRPKTGIDRRCPLWLETVTALRAVLAKRPEPKDPADASLVFITKYGFSWAKDTYDNPITKEMRKLLDSLCINGNRNFWSSRHPPSAGREDLVNS